MPIWVWGRMGVPYRERGLSIIALLVDGSTDACGAMTGKLGNIPGVKVRSVRFTAAGAGAFPQGGFMKRIEMEHIGYVPHVPQPGPHPGTLPFVQIDAERCVGCDTCQEYCPTGAIFGEVGREHAIPHPEACINCGQCLTHCPELAIYEEQSWVPELEAKLARKGRPLHRHARACRALRLGDCFGLPVGSVGTAGCSPHSRPMASPFLGYGIRADVTIWEEASES